MHVAMVVRCFSTKGGLELYSHQLIEGLLDRQIHVTVFCQDNESTLEHELLTVRPIAKRPRKLSKAQRLEHDFNAANLALADTSQFDVVHSQHYPTSKATAVTFHNHAVHRWLAVGQRWEIIANEAKAKLIKSYRLRDEYDRILCQNSRCLIFPAKVMQEDYYQTYQFLQKGQTPYVVAYPGASLNDSAGSSPEVAAPARSPGPFNFLFVGRGYRRKGLDVLQIACAKLAKEGRDFRLLIAGLSAKPLDRARLSLMGISDKVKYLGFQSDMASVYRSADAAVLPSRIEPFGMAPLQAMQFGLVPIVSKVSGASEVLKHGQDSLILDNHLDPNELARHMARLMDEPELLARLSKQARETALSVTWNDTVLATLPAYEIVMGSASETKTAVQ